MDFKTCNRCGKIIKFGAVCECKKDQINERRKYKREYQQKYEEENPEIVKPLKTQGWKNLRKNIILRDGGYCQRCKNLLGIINTKDLEVHHIKPRVTHPWLIFEPTNLITVCSECNMALGTTGELDFKPDTELTDRDYLIF